MMDITEINKNIHKITLPYKDIFTTVLTVHTAEGVILFDAASFDEDVDGYIIPMLNKLGITSDMLKYVFISHNHKDHAGGLNVLMGKYPDITVLSRSAALKDNYGDYKVVCPEDGEVILDVFKIVTIPGHTEDSMALLDTRTNTLLTGDCLQLYGIFGSQDWGSNIGFPVEHIEAVEKVRKMAVDEIYTAHDYHPYGTNAKGKEAVNLMLDACIEPIERVKQIICDNPEWDDDAVRKEYNSAKVPPISTRLVIATRKALDEGRI